MLVKQYFLFMVCGFVLVGCGGGSSESGPIESVPTPPSNPTPIPESSWNRFNVNYSGSTSTYEFTRSNTGETVVAVMETIDLVSSLVFGDLANEKSFFQFQTGSLPEDENFRCDAGTLTQPDTNNDFRIAFVFGNCVVEDVVLNGEMFVYLEDNTDPDSVVLNIDLEITDPNIDLEASLFGYYAAIDASDFRVELLISEANEAIFVDFEYLSSFGDSKGTIYEQTNGSIEVLLEPKTFSRPNEFELTLEGNALISVNGKFKENAIITATSLSIFELDFSLAQGIDFINNKREPNLVVEQGPYSIERNNLIFIDILQSSDPDIQPLEYEIDIIESPEGAITNTNANATGYSFRTDKKGEYSLKLIARDPDNIATELLAPITVLGLSPEILITSSVETNGLNTQQIQGNVDVLNNQEDGPFSLSIMDNILNISFDELFNDFIIKNDFDYFPGAISSSFVIKALEDEDRAFFNRQEVSFNQTISTPYVLNFHFTDEFSLNLKPDLFVVNDELVVYQDELFFKIIKQDRNLVYSPATDYPVVYSPQEILKYIFQNEDDQLFGVLVNQDYSENKAQVRVLNLNSGMETKSFIIDVLDGAEVTSRQFTDVFGNDTPELIAYFTNGSNKAYSLIDDTTAIIGNFPWSSETWCDVNNDGIKEQIFNNNVIDGANGNSIRRFDSFENLLVVASSNLRNECLLLSYSFNGMILYDGHFNLVEQLTTFSSLTGVEQPLFRINAWVMNADDDPTSEIIITLDFEESPTTVLLNNCESNDSSCDVSQISNIFYDYNYVFTADTNGNGIDEVLIQQVESSKTKQLLLGLNNDILSQLAASIDNSYNAPSVVQWFDDEIRLSNDTSIKINESEVVTNIIDSESVLANENGSVASYKLDFGQLNNKLTKYLDGNFEWEIEYNSSGSISPSVYFLNNEVGMVGNLGTVFFDRNTGEIIYSAPIEHRVSQEPSIQEPFVIHGPSANYVVMDTFNSNEAYFVKIAGSNVSIVNSDLAVIIAMRQEDFFRAQVIGDDTMDLVLKERNESFTINGSSIEEQATIFLPFDGPSEPLANPSSLVQSCIDDYRVCRYSLYNYSYNGRTIYSVYDKRSNSSVISGKIGPRQEAVGARFIDGKFYLLVEDNHSNLLLYGPD